METVKRWLIATVLWVAMLLTLAVVFPDNARAAEPLSREDWGREVAFIMVGLADYGQTRDIKNHPGMYEVNPMLGSNPSDAKIRNYFLAAGASHLLVTYLLPPKYRPYWQWGTIAVETTVVMSNHSLGLRVRLGY